MKTFKTLFAISFLLLITAALAFISPPSANTTGVGIRSYASQAANLPVVSSTTVVSTDLTASIAANQHLHIRFNVPFTLGGTAPGIKFSVLTPAAPASFNSAVTVLSNAPAISLVSVITTAAAQGITLATAGNHIAIVEVDIINGSTAGSVVLQFAQNVSDAAATTVLKGAYAEVVKL